MGIAGDRRSLIRPRKEVGAQFLARDASFLLDLGNAFQRDAAPRPVKNRGLVHAASLDKVRAAKAPFRQKLVKVRFAHAPIVAQLTTTVKGDRCETR